MRIWCLWDRGRIRKIREMSRLAMDANVSAVGVRGGDMDMDVMIGGGIERGDIEGIMRGRIGTGTVIIDGGRDPGLGSIGGEEDLRRRRGVVMIVGNGLSEATPLLNGDVILRDAAIETTVIAIVDVDLQATL